MHACMCARTHRSAVMSLFIYLLTAMHACMHARMHACMCARTHRSAVMYVFIYLLTAMHGTWGLVWAHLGGGTGSSSAAKTWGLV